MEAPTGASPPPRSVKLSNFDIYTTRQKLYVVGLDHLSHRSYVCKIDRYGSFTWLLRAAGPGSPIVDGGNVFPACPSPVLTCAPQNAG